MSDSTPSGPNPISRRETLKRAAGALALGLGAPVAALAATSGDSDDNAIEYRLSFWKGEEGEAFHTIRLSRRDAEKLRGGVANSYIKFDGVDGESVRPIGQWTFSGKIER